MIRLEVKNYNTMLIETLPKYIKIDIYENLTGEEILPSNQKQIIEKAKFTYFFSKFTYICFLGKAFEIKTIEVQGGKQIKAIQDQGIIKAIKNIYL